MKICLRLGAIDINPYIQLRHSFPLLSFTICRAYPVIFPSSSPARRLCWRVLMYRPSLSNLTFMIFPILFNCVTTHARQRTDNEHCLRLTRHYTESSSGWGPVVRFTLSLFPSIDVWLVTEISIVPNEIEINFPFLSLYARCHGSPPLSLSLFTTSRRTFRCELLHNQFVSNCCDYFFW